MAKDYGYEITFVESACTKNTLKLADGYDAICIFVNDYVNDKMVDKLYEMGVKAILLRCAGFDNVDLKACKDKITVSNFQKEQCMSNKNRRLNMKKMA